MPIIIQSESGAQLVSPIRFSREEELEKVLMDHPELLQDDNEAEDERATTIKFVFRQLGLPEWADKLDLLFVSSDGLPIVVEVKLGENAEARRAVIGQAIDYLSALTSLTVDELDERVGGRLEQVLQELARDDDQEFEHLWREVGSHLRAGEARLVVALDDAPPALERIFRFLTDAWPKLDVQLLTVQQYPDKAGKIFVSRTRVNSASARGSSNSGREPGEPLPQLVAVFKAYNEAPNDAPAIGNARHYRMVRVAVGPRLLHYNFSQRTHIIIVAFHGDANDPIIRRVASELDGKAVQGEKLVWEPDWRGGGGRLAARFPLETPPQTVAAAMRDLISLTRAAVDASLMQHTS